jgi:hypothetical protein
MLVFVPFEHSQIFTMQAEAYNSGAYYGGLFVVTKIAAK